MDLDDAQTDLTVAAAVAGCTVAVTLILEYVLAVEASVLLRLSPLVVYVVYQFGHERLPVRFDQPLLWVVLTAVVGITVILIAV